MWISLWLLTNLFAADCEIRELRVQDKPGSYQSQKLEICHVPKTISLRSASCHKDPKSCFKSKVDVAPVEPDYGNPKFRACRSVQGVPDFVEVKLDGRWFRTALCYFNQKKDFVDTDTVLDLTQK
jgi:hypothetical protein